MKNTRKIHSATFKAKDAMAALSQFQTNTELASKHEIHISQIGKWKKFTQNYLTSPVKL